MARMPASRLRWSAPLCAVWAVCALSQVAGCFGPLVRPHELIERLRPPSSNAGRPSGMVTLDVAVLEIPISDRGVLSAIWNAADEQVVAADRRSRLEDNGIRVGIVGGIPPAAFLNALMSDKTNPAPHQWL